MDYAWEYLSLARRVAVLHDGKIEQTGTVDDVFRRPATPFVADFVGMKNVLPIEEKNGRLAIGALTLKMPHGNGQHRLAAILPEHVHLTPVAPGAVPKKGFSGRIAAISNQGFFAELAVDVSGITFKTVMLTSSLMSMNLRQGESVSLHIDPAYIHLI